MTQTPATQTTLWCDLDGCLAQTIPAALKAIYKGTGYAVPTSAISDWGVGACAANYINLHHPGAKADPEVLESYVRPLFDRGEGDFYLGLTPHWTILTIALNWEHGPVRFLTNRPGRTGSHQVRYQTEAWLTAHGLDASNIFWATGYPGGKGPAVSDALLPGYHIFIEDSAKEAWSIHTHVDGALVFVPQRPWNFSVLTNRPYTPAGRRRRGQMIRHLPDGIIADILRSRGDLASQRADGLLKRRHVS